MNKLLKELSELLTENPWSDDLPEGWDIVESGDWTDSHKSESKEDVVFHAATRRHFMICFSRTGDHWQGYETEFVDAFEVEPYEKVITAYRKVNSEVLPATISMAKEVPDV